MDLRKLSDDVSVAPQILPEEMPAIAALGFRSILCNRPNNEDPGQPDFQELAAAAQDAGLDFRHIPVAGRSIDDADAMAYRAALAEMPGPVLAYCRSGTRSTYLWALAVADKMPVPAIMMAARAAGYDVSPLARSLANRGKAASQDTDAIFDVVIVGGGSAGIAVAASLIKRAPDLNIAIIDPAEVHYYQPGWTMVGAGIFDAQTTAKTMGSVVPKGVHWLNCRVVGFEPRNNIIVTEDARTVQYSRLILCPGLQLDWDKIDGLTETLGKNGVTSNYRYDLAPYTWDLVRDMKSGRALFTQPPYPYKCPGAPQKALYMSGDIWRRGGVLNDIDISFMNAGNVLFAVKDYVPALEEYIALYGVDVQYHTNLVAVDGDTKTATFEVSTKGQKLTQISVEFDMMHVTPPQSAPDFIKVSPFVDNTGWINVDHATLRLEEFENIWALGDVTNAPCAKTAAAAWAQAPVVAQNLVDDIASKSPKSMYTGYGSCPLTVERGKVVLAEFGYGGVLQPRFPTWLLDGTRPTRKAWFLKEQLLPGIYWSAMLRGKEWLAKPEKLTRK